MKIIIGAHTPIGAPFVVGSHHYASSMAELGHEVIHVPFPIALSDLVRANIYNWSWLIIKHKLMGKALVPEFFNTLSLKQRSAFCVLPRKLLPINRIFDHVYSLLVFSRFNKVCDLLIIDHPMQYWLINMVRAKTIIYRPTDTYAHEGEQDCKLFNQLETFILSRSSGVVATSQVVLDALSVNLAGLNRFKLPKLVITNGVSYEYFSKVQQETNQPRKNVAIYVGALDSRFDKEMLIYLAKSFPQFEFRVIGLATKAFVNSLQNCANIVCTGPKPYDQLAAELARCKVGLLLANDHVANNGRSPMKIYEYAAAGLPVISKSTPEIESRHEGFIYTYKNKKQAGDLFMKVTSDFSNLSRVATLAAQGQSWHVKTKSLLGFSEKVALD